MTEKNVCLIFSVFSQNTVLFNQSGRTNHQVLNDERKNEQNELFSTNAE